MKLAKILFIFLVIVSCQETQIWQEIEVGKTVKINSKKFKSDNKNFIYNWSKPIGNAKDIEYVIQNDKILVKAQKSGEYKIKLTVQNLSNEIVHTENFYLNAIHNTENSFIITEKAKPDLSSTIQNKSKRYTIQVASWPEMDKAIEDKNNLISLGYDAYIEKYENKEKNILRWRVRIGSFESRKLAIEVKNNLSKFRGKDIWIDKIN